MVLQFNINKTNAKIVATNKPEYVLGAGWVDFMGNYTNTVKSIYHDSSGFFKGWTLKDKHTYHVFESRIKYISREIKYRDIITYKGEKYKVSSAYLGVLNECKIKYNEPPHSRTIDFLSYDGVDMSCLLKPVKFIIHVTPLNIRDHGKA